MLGIIAGTLLFEDARFSKLTRRSVKTSYGAVDLFFGEGFCFLQRHGAKHLPPHRINHKANIAALRKAGVTAIVALNSVGSLKPRLKPGSILVPDDYLQLRGILTFHDEKSVHIAPTLENDARKKVVAAARRARIPVATGVYATTQGPRFETKAEIALLASFADVVGMTLGPEATLAQEAGIDYCAICSVDNYANGIGVVDYAVLKKTAAKNAARVLKLLDAVLEQDF
jgi:5'-methylthioadenosine phosphorylase